MSLRTALAASLVLNVFAAGALGGGTFMLFRHGAARTGPGALPSGPAAAGQDLPQTERVRFRTTVRAVLAENRDLIRGATEARSTAFELFMQPSFDRAAANEALDRARAADFAVRTRLESAELDFAAGLPVEERARLALGLQRTGPLRHPPAAPSPAIPLAAPSPVPPSGAPR